MNQNVGLINRAERVHTSARGPAFVGQADEITHSLNKCDYCRVKLLGFDHICHSLIQGKVCSHG